MGVKHDRAVAGQQCVEEGERVNLHVGAGVLVSQRVLNARHDARQVLVQGPWQDQDKLSEQAEAALTCLDAFLPQLAVNGPDNVPHLALEHVQWTGGTGSFYRSEIAH